MWKQHWKKKKFYEALLHVGVNNPLNNESQYSVQNHLDNLKQLIGLKCKSAGVTRILISGIVVNNKLTSAYKRFFNKKAIFLPES